MIEYLFKINTVICDGLDKKVVIYGVGQAQKKLFHALLQQNIRIDAFCLRKAQKTDMEKIFGKAIITLQDLRGDFKDAYVIVPMGSAQEDIEVLRGLGIDNIVVENVTANAAGILIEGDLD